tara:strand:- start:2240 stop:2473 length:234 start_codon:yes stop_codon:yes gene_type:complete
MSDSDYIRPRKVNDPNTGDLKGGQGTPPQKRDPFARPSKDFQTLQEQQFIYETLKRQREIKEEKNRREKIRKQRTVI